MSPFPIDAYAYSNALRWAHPGEKILFSGSVIAICLAFASPPVSLLALVTVWLAVTRVARIPARAFWSFLQLPVGFIGISVATIMVTGVSPEAALVSVPVGPWHVGIAETSLVQAVRVLSVSLASVAASLFLALTTPMVDLADQLRRWRVPALFVELMTLIYRFIFVFIETARAMYVAQDARLGYSTAGRSFRSAGMLASTLFLRTNARASTLFTALTARGYTGDLSVLRTEPAWSAHNLRLIAAVVGVLLAVAIGVRLGGLG